MITRDFTAVITDPQGDLLALGTLEVTPATRSQVIADPDALIAGTQVYGITTGSLDGTPTIQAPGRYIFEIKDSLGATIVAFRGSVSDDVATAISLQEIAQTNITLSTLALTEGSAITLLGIGDGADNEVLQVNAGAVNWGKINVASNVVAGGTIGMAVVITSGSAVTWGHPNYLNTTGIPAWSDYVSDGFGATGVWRAHKYDAVAPPGVNDDELSDFQVGSWWLYPGGSAIYLCSDATAGAAVWTLIASWK